MLSYFLPVLLTLRNNTVVMSDAARQDCVILPLWENP